ncbi:hypothetical protein [Longimicrobium sp.]|uniref:hypothetical protein n=1 Tax=Longimicrobium sp. TaxID=2029185 RepID=UPI002ED7B216
MAEPTAAEENRARDLVQTQRALGHSLDIADIAGAMAEAREEREEALNQILHAAGIDYPLGLRGVRDLVNQRDGHIDRAEESEFKLARVEALVREVSTDQVPVVGVAELRAALGMDVPG